MKDLQKEFQTAFKSKVGSGARAALLKKCAEKGINFFELYFNSLKPDSRQTTLFETIATSKKQSDKPNPISWETLA